jgi:hypothetical protein
MTDISVETKIYGPDDRAWLIGEAVGHQASTLSTKSAGLIDFTLFTANTHYPNGYLPSGLVLGVVTSGGALGPYSNAASDGRQTAVGFLYNSVSVPTPTSARKVAATVVDAFARVSESRLPANHGLDTAGKADLPLIRFDA